MNISIIGASAGVGLETTKRALDRNHFVKTFSRSAVPLPEQERLKCLQGDARQSSDVREMLSDADVLIVTLGQGNSLKATTLNEDFADLLLQLHQEKPILIQVIILSGFGAGDSLDYNPFFVKTVFKTLLKKVYADKKKMEEKIAASSLSWEIVRPGKLTNKALTENYRVETELFKGINIGKISRANVADYMIKEAESPKNIGKFVSLTE